MYEFLALESRDVHLCERLRVLRSIYAQPPLLYLLNSQVFLQIKSLKSTYDVGNKSIYDGQFRGNILVVSKTACGKTYFRQKLGLNKSFGKLIKTKLMNREKLKYNHALVTELNFIYQQNPIT